MVDRAGPKSESYKKTRRLTREELLRRGPVPTYFNGEWLGGDPEGDAVYSEIYHEDPYQLYHDWPFRCEGVVFHNRDDMLNFAWELSRNQDRDVWTQTPTGFPEKQNWWCEERLQRDGEWNEWAKKDLERRANLANETDQPTIGNKVDPPSRAEAQGRRKAYWDPKLKRTVITDEFESESISPNRRRQIQHLKKQGIDPVEPDTTQEHKAPNSS